MRVRDGGDAFPAQAFFRTHQKPCARAARRLIAAVDTRDAPNVRPSGEPLGAASSLWPAWVLSSGLTLTLREVEPPEMTDGCILWSASASELQPLVPRI